MRKEVKHFKNKRKTKKQISLKKVTIFKVKHIQYYPANSIGNREPTAKVGDARKYGVAEVISLEQQAMAQNPNPILRMQNKNKPEQTKNLHPQRKQTKAK